MNEDIKIYIPVRERNKGRPVAPQEMLFVLHNVKRLTRGWEREIMDAIITMIEEGAKNDTSKEIMD